MNRDETKLDVKNGKGTEKRAKKKDRGYMGLKSSNPGSTHTQNTKKQDVESYF